MNRVLEYLASTRLTILILVVLAAESVVGSFLYVGDTLPSGQGGMKVFSSPFFLLPSLLLLLNILVCSFKRISLRGKNKVLFVSHLFLIGAVIGLLVDGGFGRVLTGYFPYGQEESSVFDWKEGADVELPFSIEVEEYRETRHPLLLRVGVRRADSGEKVALYEVPENGSFYLPGTDVMVSRLRYSFGKKTLYFLIERENGEREAYQADSNGSPPLPGGYVIVPVAYKVRGIKDMRAKLLVRSDGRKEVVEVSPNNPGKVNGYDVSLIEVRYDRYMNLYVGLQFTRKPGESLFWLGTLGFFGSILLHFILPLAVGAEVRNSNDAAGGHREGV